MDNLVLQHPCLNAHQEHMHLLHQSTKHAGWGLSRSFNDGGTFHFQLTARALSLRALSDTFHPACVIYPAPENAVPRGHMPSADNRACVEVGDGTWLSCRVPEMLLFTRLSVADNL